MSGALVLYDEMCRAISAAYEVDEVKEIRDKARALEVYARQARNIEAERQAVEIRLRAERRAGQLLRDREKAKGTRMMGREPGGEPRRSDDTTTEKLADLHISKQQSSDWQQLADIPDDGFEAGLRRDEIPTTTGLLRFHEEQTKPRPRNVVDDDTLWLWGRLVDFERLGLFRRDPNEMIRGMLPHMRETSIPLGLAVSRWLGRIKDDEGC